MKFSIYFSMVTVAMVWGCGSSTTKPSIQNEKDVDDNVDSNTGGGTDNEDNGGGGAKSQSCVDNPTPFVSVWRTDAPNEKVTLPLVTDAGDYDITVDWADGAVLEVSNDGVRTATHTYAEAGEYTVKIEGNIGSAWSFFVASARQGAGKTYPEGSITLSQGQLESVEDLGSIGWKSLKGAFRGAKNLKKVAGGCTDEVTDMWLVFIDVLPSFRSFIDNNYDVFYFLKNVLDVDFSSWNFSGIASGDGLTVLFTSDNYAPDPDDGYILAPNHVEHCKSECDKRTSSVVSCKNRCEVWVGSLTAESYSTLLKRLADTPENGGLRDDVVDVVMTVPAQYDADAVVSRAHLENFHNFTFYDLGQASPQ